MRSNLVRLPAPQSWQRPELTRALLTASDSRLALNDRTNLNGYGCQPFPRPFAYSLSSSTASTISEAGHAAADTALSALHDVHQTPSEHRFAALTEKLRHDLKILLGLSHTDCEVAFSPSGTDAALQALCLARCVLGRDVTSVLVGAAESGSGVGLAASG